MSTRDELGECALEGLTSRAVAAAAALSDAAGSTDRAAAEARELATDASRRGWVAVATTVESAAESLERAAGGLTEAARSTTAAAGGLAPVTETTSSDEVARLLGTLTGAVEAARSALTPAAHDQELSKTSAQQAAAPRLVRAIEAAETASAEATSQLATLAAETAREQATAELWGTLANPRLGPATGPPAMGIPDVPVSLIRPSASPASTHTPRGRPAAVPPQVDEATRYGLVRENDSAMLLARLGYDVEQNPPVVGRKKPDYRIEGEIVDHVAPTTDRADNVWDRVRRKVTERQAKRAIVRLDYSSVRLGDVREKFRASPVEGLQEVLGVRYGEVRRIFP